MAKAAPGAGMFGGEPEKTGMKRKVLMVAAGVLAVLGGGALAVAALQGGSTVAPNDRAAIEKVVREYILSHPEIIPEAMQKLQQKKLSGAIDESRSALETPYAGAWEGAANGDVVLVEFFDYACRYCRQSLADISKLVAGDPKLKVVYRELPILSDESGEAAKASLYAAEQGKYMPFHRALYAAGQVSRDTILAAATTAGLDRKAVDEAMKSARYDKEVMSNITLAQSLQATGTPLFVVGDRVMNGAVGYDELKSAIAEARAGR